jgi:hypothetical protein
VPVAYSYIRFSTPDQIKGDSLRRQTEASSHYAAEHNLTLDETLNVIRRARKACDQHRFVDIRRPHNQAALASASKK